jgi:hypothetical protein
VLSLFVAAALAVADAGAAPVPVVAAAPDAAPAEFIDDVKALYQVVTCQEGALPENLDAKTVGKYCAKMKPKFERFREHWGADATKFLTALHPASLPSELVYPFGGGDMMMALTAFPHQTVYTTLSLELAGDPRRIKTLTDKKTLEQSLANIDQAATTTLLSNNSKSVNLSKIQKGDLPGQLSMHLMGLALHDYEPVSVRFFRIQDDGTLHYYSLAEVTAMEGQTATKLRANWQSPDFSPAFANVEVQFVPKGQPAATRLIHRHIAADIGNEGLKKTPGVLKHLEAKGHVAVLVKAASYLLWNDNYSSIRDYLTGHLDFMLSDSTGVPLRFCKKAGLTLETYGGFEKTFLGTGGSNGQELAALFAAQKRKLPFRFGYPDGSDKKLAHMMVTRRPAPGADAGTP